MSAYWRETDMVLFTTTSSVLKIMSERLFSKQMLCELSHISSLYKIPLFPHRIPCSSRVRGLTRVPQLVKGRAGIHPIYLTQDLFALLFLHRPHLHGDPPKISDPRKPAWRVLEAGAACVTLGSFIPRGDRLLFISRWPWWLRDSSLPTSSFPTTAGSRRAPPSKACFPVSSLSLSGSCQSHPGWEPTWWQKHFVIFLRWPSYSWCGVFIPGHSAVIFIEQIFIKW